MQARVKGDKPSQELKTYTGKYHNELFGQVTVTQQKNDLLLHFSHTHNLTATLQYMDNDEWLLTYSNPAFGIFPLKFKTSTVNYQWM